MIASGPKLLIMGALPIYCLCALCFAWNGGGERERAPSPPPANNCRLRGGRGSADGRPSDGDGAGERRDRNHGGLVVQVAVRLIDLRDAGVSDDRSGDVLGPRGVRLVDFHRTVQLAEIRLR